jgi:hypothetical protein
MRCVTTTTTVAKEESNSHRATPLTNFNVNRKHFGVFSHFDYFDRDFRVDDLGFFRLVGEPDRLRRRCEPGAAGSLEGVQAHHIEYVRGPVLERRAADPVACGRQQLLHVVDVTFRSTFAVRRDLTLQVFLPPRSARSATLGMRSAPTGPMSGWPR